MTNSTIKENFPSRDPAGITPGHDEPVAAPPDPHVDTGIHAQRRLPDTQADKEDAEQDKGKPASDPVSIGTSSSNQQA